MPPLKTYKFKYLNTDIELIIKAYSDSQAYNKLNEIVKDSEEWLQIF